jgi:hypothetical protein
MINAKVVIDSAETVNKFPQFIKGEYGFDIKITPVDEDGATYVLTDEVVTLIFRNINGTALSTEASVSYADSVITYTTVEADFAVTGIYEATLQIAKAGTKTREINLGTFAVFDA